jgi:hypothetical protein
VLAVKHVWRSAAVDAGPATRGDVSGEVARYVDAADASVSRPSRIGRPARIAGPKRRGRVKRLPRGIDVLALERDVDGDDGGDYAPHAACETDSDD